MKERILKFLWFPIFIIILLFQQPVHCQKAKKSLTKPNTSVTNRFTARKRIPRNSNATSIASLRSSLLFTLTLSGNSSKIYNSGEKVEADIITDKAGILETYLGNSSIQVIVGVKKYQIGIIVEPGLYFLRFKAQDGSQVTKGLLILPVSGSNKYTAEIVEQNLKISEVAIGDQLAFLKFIKKVDKTRLSAAWKKALPNWIAQNISNGVQAAVYCGVVTFGTAGAGVLVGCVVPISGSMADAFASVLTQIADDLKEEGSLSASEVASVKRSINLINGSLQTITSTGFERAINALQGIVTVIDQTDKVQVTSKVVTDGVKKYNFLMQFKPK